jgi:cystathionine beta-lyase/cystathionine gamma-synthase
METEAIHAGEIHDPSGAHIAPIFQTSTYNFDDMRAVEDYAAGEGNPARPASATKLAALEGFGLDADETASAEIFGSGMAAISAGLMAWRKQETTRLDLLRRSPTVTETLSDVRGQVALAAPKTAVARRQVALPRFSARS